MDKDEDGLAQGCDDNDFPKYDLGEYVVCKWGFCDPFFLKFLSVVNPAEEVVIESFEIVNGNFFFPPLAGMTVAETAATIFPQAQAEALALKGRDSQSGNPWRMEVWSRAIGQTPADFRALVAEYDPRDVEFGDLTFGEYLFLKPPGEDGTLMSVEAAWEISAEPGVSGDTDEEGIPDNSGSCRSAPDTDRADGDSDGIGDACEPESELPEENPVEICGDGSDNDGDGATDCDDPDCDCPSAALFIRGDANGDGAVEIGDPIFTLFWQLVGVATPTCVDAADANDDGTVDMSDVVVTLDFVFLGGTPPPAPYSACGRDPTPDDLGCENYPVTACP